MQDTEGHTLVKGHSLHLGFPAEARARWPSLGWPPLPQTERHLRTGRQYVHTPSRMACGAASPSTRWDDDHDIRSESSFRT